MGFRTVASLNGIVSLAYGAAGFVAPLAWGWVLVKEARPRERVIA